MKGETTELFAFMDGAQKRFIIPVYQRNYDWKQTNCIQLYNDLVDIIKLKKKSHFFGSIVSYAQSKNELVIVDGQQRITTVSLILIALVNALNEGKCRSDNTHLAQIISAYLVNKFHKEKSKVRLKPFRDDCDAFDKLIYSKPSDYVQESLVTKNYQFFYQKITEEKLLTADELFEALGRLQIFDVELERPRGDNPQLIFERLNSTGLNLAESDKVRNYVLMNQGKETQARFYNDYWSVIEKICVQEKELDGFIRNYLTIKTTTMPTLSDLYKAFKEYAKGKDIEAVLADMTKYALAYKKIVSCQFGDAETNAVAKRINLLDTTVAYPFFMAYVVYADENKLDNAETRKVFSCVEIYIFRRIICGLTTPTLAPLHNYVLKNITNKYSYSDLVIYYLRSRPGSGTFPSDEEFIKNFVTRSIHSMRAKNKEYIFDRLENGGSKETHDVVQMMEDGTYSVEHIMPQNLTKDWRKALGPKYQKIHETWLHTIANLTLTAYNVEYGNKTFAEKKTMPDGFSDSHIKMNHYIAQFNNWTEKELIARRDKLSKDALKLWPIPNTKFKAPDGTE